MHRWWMQQQHPRLVRYQHGDEIAPLGRIEAGLRGREGLGAPLRRGPRRPVRRGRGRMSRARVPSRASRGGPRRPPRATVRRRTSWQAANAARARPSAAASTGAGTASTAAWLKCRQSSPTSSRNQATVGVSGTGPVPAGAGGGLVEWRGCRRDGGARSGAGRSSGRSGRGPARRARATICRLRIESPPSSKKLPSGPMPSRSSTAAKTVGDQALALVGEPAPSAASSRVVAGRAASARRSILPEAARAGFAGARSKPAPCGRASARRPSGAGRPARPCRSTQAHKTSCRRRRRHGRPPRPRRPSGMPARPPRSRPARPACRGP